MISRSYKVRERPPSYFALESERIRTRAKDELGRMAQRRDERRATATPAAAAAPAAASAMLVVLRHGYSEFNRENLFTGAVMMMMMMMMLMMTMMRRMRMMENLFTGAAADGLVMAS